MIKSRVTEEDPLGWILDNFPISHFSFYVKKGSSLKLHSLFHNKKNSEKGKGSDRGKNPKLKPYNDSLLSLLSYYTQITPSIVKFFFFIYSHLVYSDTLFLTYIYIYYFTIYFMNIFILIPIDVLRVTRRFHLTFCFRLVL